MLDISHVAIGLLALSAPAALDLRPAVVQLQPDDTEDSILTKAASVRPSARQLAWQQLEFIAFVHFGMNTFTGREWGDGTEDPAWFNPTELDARQWVAACKAAGMKQLILTAKHHDGFCLWPSAYTEHCVRNSPWRDGKGDVVREVADACREGGIKFGVYLSPWDRHEPTYGDSPAYNRFYINQLRELLSDYGEISEVWFDGACGEGPNGRRQEYDWDAYYAVVRELQPSAVIFGGDVRWCGNEAGISRDAEWSVVPTNLDVMGADTGSRSLLSRAAQAGAGLHWYPSEVDVSIRPGWFYHEHEDGAVKTLEHLLDIYYTSVGGNNVLLLNIPPDRRGLFHESDVRRLRELGDVLRATFDENLALGARATADASAPGRDAALTVDGNPNTYWTTDAGVTTAAIEYELGAPRTFDRAVLQEYIADGQRIEGVALDVREGGQWREVARGQTVGYKRILRFPEVTASRVRLRVTESRVRPTLACFELYRAPSIVSAPTVERHADGLVHIASQAGAETRYWLQTTGAEGYSMPYKGPFPLPGSGVVHAIAIPDDRAKCVVVGESLLTRAVFGDQVQDETRTQIDPTDWRDFRPDMATAPIRVTDALPLSDQSNEGGWIPYAPMSDEFEGAELDSTKWWPRNPGWLGRQPGLFLPENVSVRDGRLHLTMRKENRADMPAGYRDYTCAAVRSKNKVRYGYFEVRARAMRSAGSSSFWFYQDDPEWWTEIDVFEIGGGASGYERKLNMTVHVMRTPVESQHQSIGSSWETPAPLADDYHVYGLEWDEDWLRFYFDGLLVREGRNTHWHQPLTLNFDSETMPEWFGLPRDEDLPSTYSIEYVRAWKKR